MWTLAVVVVAAACSSGPQPIDDTAHDQEILAWRVAKDAMFKSSSDTPLMPDDVAKFTGLPYYPIDAAYRMPAVLRQNPAQPSLIIELPTSSSEMRRMQRVGSLSFNLKGTALSLTAFADEGDTAIRRLFVPFGDLTSGTETYGGGRYLELDRSSSGMYDLDFNRAYHPYCVYNVSYVCPVPPRENRLAVAIQAGERLPHTIGR